MQPIDKDIVLSTGGENPLVKVVVPKEEYNNLISTTKEIDPNSQPDAETHSKVCATRCSLDIVDINGFAQTITINFETCMALAQIVDRTLRVVISSLVKQPENPTENQEVIVPEVITNG